MASIDAYGSATAAIQHVVQTIAPKRSLGSVAALVLMSHGHMSVAIKEHVCCYQRTFHPRVICVACLQILSICLCRGRSSDPTGTNSISKWGLQELTSRLSFLSNLLALFVVISCVCWISCSEGLLRRPILTPSASVGIFWYFFQGAIGGSYNLRLKGLISPLSPDFHCILSYIVDSWQ